MADQILNREILPESDCFGCGLANPHGLRVAIRREEDDADRLLATLRPGGHMTGFPGITHGGVIYTAMDCLAAWVPRILRSDTKAAWITRSATVKYHKAAKQGEPLSIVGSIASEGTQWQPVEVRTEARNPAGELLTDATFKVVPLSAERFKEVAEIEEIPEAWRAMIE
ncbi:MAG: PaaI family thioesterase [Gemmatimonadota bacterium]|nr:MAG: PaaI family thioesterase [Gemmatimonadota bacterium]